MSFDDLQVFAPPLVIDDFTYRELPERLEAALSAATDEVRAAVAVWSRRRASL